MFAKANNDQKFMFISGGPHKILFSWTLLTSSTYGSQAHQLRSFWLFKAITVIDKTVADRA